MSNPAADGPATTASSESEHREPSLDAAKIVDQVRAVLASVEAHSEETSRILGELARISSAFDAVTNRLLEVTFSVTNEATSAAPSRAALVTIVEELGAIARTSLGAASEARRAVQNRNSGAPATRNTLRTLDGALQDLSTALTRLAARPARPRPAPAIEIETRIPETHRTESSPSARPSGSAWALERAIAATGGGRVPKSGGYKN